MAALRRKLDALNYTDTFDQTSAALVGKLLNDLVYTTESFRTLKLQQAKAAQEQLRVRST